VFKEKAESQTNKDCFDLQYALRSQYWTSMYSYVYNQVWAQI